MAIEKNNFKVLGRFDSEVSPRSRDTIMSSEDEDNPPRNSAAVESDDDDDDFDDCDSGAGSDDFDLLELGEAGEEFCQVGDQTCSIPYELYDLSGLRDILSLDVWNDVLTEEDRFSLTQYLPDMDQEYFLITLKELFEGCDLHFGNPVDKLFEMLKGGLSEPRVALYRQGLNFFQKRKHYHLVRKHQNSMVTNLCQIRDAWSSCKGYSIEEKLRVLNIMKSQKSLMSEKMEEMESESERESGDGLWGKRAKDRKLGQNMGRHSLNSGVDVYSRDKQMALEPAKFGKQNPKGALKSSGMKVSTTKDLAGRLPSVHHGLDMKSGALSRHNKPAGYDYGAAVQLRNQIPGDNEEEEPMYEVSLQRDRNFSRFGSATKANTFKMGRKYEDPMGEEYTDSFTGSPMPWKNNLHAYGRNKPVNQLSDIKVLTAKPSIARAPFDYGKKVKYSENFQQLGADDQMRFRKGHISNLSVKGTRMDAADGSEPFFPGRAQEEPFPNDPSYKYSEWKIKSKKGKMSRESPDVSDMLFPSKHRAQPLHEKFRAHNGGPDARGVKGYKSFGKNDETESDSSEQVDEDDDNPLMRSKWAYPSGMTDLNPSLDHGKAMFVKKDKKEYVRTVDGSSNFSRRMDDFGENPGIRKVGVRGEPMGKMHDIGYLNSSSGRNFDDSYLSGSGRVLSGDDDWQQLSNSGRNNGHMHGGYGERFHGLPQKDRRKGEYSREYVDPQSTYMHGYNGLPEENHLLSRPFVGDNGNSARMGKKGQQIVESHVDNRFEIPSAQLMSCNSGTKKRKVKNDLMYIDEQDNKEFYHSDMQPQLDGSDTLRKRGKKKMEDGNDPLEKEISEPPLLETKIEDVVELDVKPQKKPYILITPTIHTGFSFSIVHILSAVRMAMVTLLPENSLDDGNHLDKNEGKPMEKEEQDSKPEDTNKTQSHDDADVNKSSPSARVNVPSLTVQEIVNRVRSNPGDPCILETQEPLQDLVRGVLKIYSSKTAPLGAKGWKPLVVYEKATKSWSWIGPVNHSSSEQEAIEEVTSPESWGLPHKMLVKLVDAFANWLKNGQETLQQIGSLPAPPLSLMQYNLDEKERFKDLRAQKSLSTITPSSEEVRAYFRKEEVLRYSIPDRAFSYTAIDGKKSIVAPLRRCGGKPTSKARDHFMLKRDRPPHVTILCLVRDAAARLPGSIGTRADVCTLIRDSQYIVEDVSDSQVNQVVSGALDRLHYERDPCVQFDGERKLWVYLHREREEEDFEDDGTSSTKKWKRQRKEAAEPDQGSVTVAYPGTTEQTGIDLTSDLNAEPQCTDEDKGADLIVSNDDDKDTNIEDFVDIGDGVEQGGLHHDPAPMAWDALDLNPLQETKLLCQENSTNEDYDDEPLAREPSS